MDTKEREHQQDLEKIKAFRYMDDDFMTVCLEDNIEGVELILRIIMQRQDITVTAVRVQEAMKNLKGRSAVLDVHAVDSSDKEYDVEIQRMDAGAGAKRARHNSSLLDSHILRPGEDTDKMPDSYVIFITENDVMGRSKAIYHIQRYVEVDDEKELFGDGSHIIYVNGKYRGDDEIGRLMHDFSCTNPDDMNYKVLAERARYFKENEKGQGAMCKMLEDMRNETELRVLKKTAIRMIKDGEMSLEKIAEYTELSLNELKEIEAESKTCFISGDSKYSE